jgi:hypothetical protein
MTAATVLNPQGPQRSGGRESRALWSAVSAGKQRDRRRKASHEPQRCSLLAYARHQESATFSTDSGREHAAISILQSGSDVWKALLDSGLNPLRTTGSAGYDESIEVEMKARLFPGSSHSLEEDLVSKFVSTEDFLETFFDTVEPFATMLRDSLAMFEAASAQRGDRNLKIAFNLDSASQELALTLQHFRQIEDRVRLITRSVSTRQWNSNSLFVMSAALQSAMIPWDIPGLDRPFDDVASLRDRRLADWIANSGRPEWLDLPGIAQTGDNRFDRALRLAEDLIRSMLTEVRKLGRTYDEFARRRHELPWHEGDGERDAPEDSAEMPIQERPKRQFVEAAHDYWPNSFARLLGLAVEHIAALSGTPRMNAVSLVTEVLEHEFERQPVVTRPITELERNLFEFLNLPIWQKRHELYSVWVASQTASGLSHLQWEWHPEGDTLRFPFFGAHLATLRSSTGTYQFWTEMRTELPSAGVKGRRSIQPDYRIVAAPVHRLDATTIVIECKQYRTPSTGNFSAALDDYVLGCPASQVVLVNYGKAGDHILGSVHEERRNRTHLIGEFRPGVSWSLDGFRRLLASVFPEPQTGTVLEPAPDETAEIVLRWGPEFGDLDLHVQIVPLNSGETPVWINYESRGSDRQEPWAWLDADVRAPGIGHETIRVERLANANYLVFVHDYSGSDRFPHGDVAVSVRFGREAEAKVFAPGGGRHGRWWLAAVVSGPDKMAVRADVVLDERP